LVWYGRRVAQASVTLAEEREGTVVGLFQADPTAAPRITPQALAEQLAGPNPPIVLDVRARAQYDQDAHQIPVSVRLLPDQIEAWAHTEPPQRAVVTYCA
jgi:hypothetical protein